MNSFGKLKMNNFHSFDNSFLPKLIKYIIMYKLTDKLRQEHEEILAIFNDIKMLDSQQKQVMKKFLF